MKPTFLPLKYLIVLVWICLPFYGNSQESRTAYNLLVREADSLMPAGQHLPAAQKFTAAFRSFGWKGMTYDRYYAARCWALAGVPDSAFFQLEKLAYKGNYDDAATLRHDTAFIRLRADVRWPELVRSVRKNGGFDERFFDQKLFDFGTLKKQ